MKSGVYQIVNTINGKRYIGSSINIKKRWREHRGALKGRRHHNTYLQRSWDKYGKSNFDFQVIYYCGRDTVCNNEQFFLDVLSPEYNILDIAGRPPVLTGEDNPNYGKHFTKEHRRKIAKANTGYRHSEETKKKLSKLNSGINNPNYGKIPSKETRRKISEAKMGHGVSVETRKKISETKTGTHLTAETIRKISESNMGKHHSEESKQKISKALKGIPKSEEHKRKLSEANKGKHLSDETKHKISEALKWQKGESHPQYICFSSGDMAKMREMRGAGFSYRKIGERFDVSGETIRRRMLKILTRDKEERNE